MAFNFEKSFGTKFILGRNSVIFNQHLVIFSAIGINKVIDRAFQAKIGLKIGSTQVMTGIIFDENRPFLAKIGMNLSFLCFYLRIDNCIRRSE